MKLYEGQGSSYGNIYSWIIFGHCSKSSLSLQCFENTNNLFQRKNWVRNLTYLPILLATYQAAKSVCLFTVLSQGDPHKLMCTAGCIPPVTTLMHSSSPRP